MAEEKMDREGGLRGLLPWTELFKGFQVALDLNKLLLAAAGIVVMFLGWWLLAVVFAAGEDRTPPDWGTYPDKTSETWGLFRRDRGHWNLMHEAMGLAADPAAARYEVADIAETRDEYNTFNDPLKKLGVTGAEAVKEVRSRAAELRKAAPNADVERAATAYEARAGRYIVLGREKPHGRLSVSPWQEDRGPNPYLLVTGQAGAPWEAGFFFDWFVRDQAPVMFEPLYKLARPIIYFLSPRNTNTSRFYFLLVTLWAVVTWSVFGGAITRIAAVQLTRGEKIGATEALRFVSKRLRSYVLAPIFPLGLVFGLLVAMAVFAVFYLIPVVGDILVAGLLWPVVLVMGGLMAIVLVGLVGWPLMAATVSTEGTDAWEAVSRSYSYVYQRPWQYVWYSFVAILYGGILVLFIGFMGSLTVYLSKWGVGLTPKAVRATSREPSFLFVYAPSSFGWRQLLLEGAEVNATPEEVKAAPADSPLKTHNGAEVVSPDVQLAGVSGAGRWSRINPPALAAYKETMSWWNTIGAVMVSFWLGLAFLLLLGFGYSFFWTSGTIIYLLLRKSVDAAEMDEVYLEEEDYEPPVLTAPAPPAAPAKAPSQSLPIVEAPRPAPAPAFVPPPAAATEPAPPPAAEKPADAPSPGEGPSP